MTVRLSFSDFIDLQSRLVLLPRIEEEGVGAILASYTPSTRLEDSFQEEKKVDGNENDPPHSDNNAGVETSKSMDSVELTENQQNETDEGAAEKSGEQQKSSESEDVTSNQSSDLDERPETLQQSCTESDAVNLPEELIGKALVGIDGVETQDWLVSDFSTILASIREAKSPIVLQFESNPSVHSSFEDDEESVGREETENQAPENSENDSKVTMNSWSSWGKSLASNAKVYASATATVVASKAAEARAARQLKPTVVELPPRAQKCYAYLQMTDGSFVQLCGAPSKLPKVTTSSIVVVRQSPNQPCNTKCFSFQWFRSFSAPKGSDMSSSSSRASSASGSIGGSFDGEERWTILEGATYAAYQPSATDIGHRLKCEVLFEVNNEDADASVDESSVAQEIIICETPAPISADMPMFNAARGALSRGAKFSNLVGRGPAEGRTFGIQVEISICSEDKSISSAMTIQQVSGQTSEPMHIGAIKKASAIADPANPKQFDLVFPFGLPEGSSMVSALSADGRLRFTAPNRLTRETLLLALGIANFSGNPCDLTETTVLFPGRVQYPGMIEKELIETPVKQLLTSRDLEFFTSEKPAQIAKSDDDDDQSGNRVRALEEQLQQMRSKLSRKNKVVSDLQRKLSQSVAKAEKSERIMLTYQKDLQRTHDEATETRKKLRMAEKRIETHEAVLMRTKGDHSNHISVLEERIMAQSERVADAEKAARTLQNEKAILSAGVEARDSKLDKMNDLQLALQTLSAKVAKGDALRSELTDMGKRYEVLCIDLEKVAASETECKEQLENAQSTMDSLYHNLDSETKRRTSCQQELVAGQKAAQKLKSERNSYKQKAESLAKEIGRLCKGGRTLRDVEKALIDEESRKTEVQVLRSQKQKALEDLHQYRTAYEQQLVAQLNIGVDGAAIKALEQKAELERVVSDLTEYITAKEMQLDTMRQVNEALADEMKQLAKANMDKNEI